MRSVCEVEGREGGEAKARLGGGGGEAHLCQEDKDTSRVNPCMCVLCVDDEGINA